MVRGYVAARPGHADCIGRVRRIALPNRERGDGTPPSSTPTWRSFAMPATYDILIMGASYGSLLASKLLFGGHRVHLVCLPAEADLINAEGFRVRLPIRGRQGPGGLRPRQVPGQGTGGRSRDVHPGGFGPGGAGMPEPQYRSAGVRELLDAVAKARVPCMSIMNMPPLAYLRRIPGL